MWRELATLLSLAILAIHGGSSEAASKRLILPIEIMGADGTTVTQTVTLRDGQSESVRSLWLQVHGLRYSEQASVQVNESPWIRLENGRVTVAEPARSFGSIGGGFRTVVLTVPLANNTVGAGANVVRFRFNRTDGLANGFRVLAWNFLRADGSRLLPPGDLWRIRLKVGLHHCLMQTPFVWGGNCGTQPLWLPVACLTVRGFRRVAQTVMRMTGGTLSTSTSPTQASSRGRASMA